VAPRAARDEVRLEGDGSLKIRIQAPPVDGKANQALCRFLAKRLGVPRRDVALLSGDTGRRKGILVRGLTPADVEARLL
jgi:uncharacterized protein (TIGR00251 family)